ncbi:MAG: hypothetical protein BWY50_02025 [Spirochaetes bacterium ADurb.Bin315]|nr:MAG: hypothetical protein BWY50_02025 [Spirochaetes bacterium ADurb.Bin315]
MFRIYLANLLVFKQKHMIKQSIELGKIAGREEENRFIGGLNEPCQVFPPPLVEIVERFIQNPKRSIKRLGCGEEHPLALPSGKFAVGNLSQFIETPICQSVLHPSSHLFRRKTQ